MHEGPQALATVSIPDADESIQGTRHDEGAVVHDVDAGDRVGVGWKGAHDSRSAYVPYEYGFVI